MKILEEHERSPIQEEDESVHEDHARHSNEVGDDEDPRPERELELEDRVDGMEQVDLALRTKDAHD